VRRPAHSDVDRALMEKTQNTKTAHKESRFSSAALVTVVARRSLHNRF